MIVGGRLGYKLLQRICPGGESGYNDGSVYAGRSKLEVLFGPQLWPAIQGQTVLDFGCGEGHEAAELATRGAARVIGLDTYAPVLEKARAHAARVGVADRCTFAADTDEPADVILSLDSFEHFPDPAAVLVKMRSLVRPSGCLLASFGPTWFHPLGGHVFSVFPWAHFLFTERAFIRWFADFNHDGHTSFASVGLNRMTIRRFEKIVADSPWQFTTYEVVPIRPLKRLHNRLTREFTTSIVRCKLTPRSIRPES
jgi:2-polyprenyl-3-methyl-5-hydroxy-6-metoxy-1,4-benzoquinol methylase